MCVCKKTKYYTWLLSKHDILYLVNSSIDHHHLFHEIYPEAADLLIIYSDDVVHFLFTFPIECVGGSKCLGFGLAENEQCVKMYMI